MKPGTSKSGKFPAVSTSDFSTPSPQVRPLVPPVLREVGKLAAGVASVSTGSSSGGSATGNLRNKYALAPGHSLMDWIRLGASGRDLTGVGAQAGHFSVTPVELALHNKKTDGWLAIRGRVYNVTSYFPFHPGGPDELMRAIGRDATSLFEEVHPWVNFDQILSKCYVGPLRSASHNIDAEEVFGPLERKPQQSSTSNSNNDEATPLPRFDWIQKIDYINTFFYTGPFSNPLVEISHENNDFQSTVSISLSYHDQLFQNDIQFADKINWPCFPKLMFETGKVDLSFRKCKGKVWVNYGVLTQKRRALGPFSKGKIQFKIKNRLQVNHNTFLIELEHVDNHRIIIPLGKHVKVFHTINGSEISRSYTPVPYSLFTKFGNQDSGPICLMVKRYPDGVVSKYITDLQIGDGVTISKPLGSFNLIDIDKRETFIILAAGTGITPMFSIISFLLTRRIRKCQSLRLLFFNRTQEDMLFKQQFEDLEKDARFKCHHVLSQPHAAWGGLRGHITRSMLELFLEEHLSGTTYIKSDVYFMACGPTIFTTLTQQLLKDLEIQENQMHMFLG